MLGQLAGESGGLSGELRWLLELSHELAQLSEDLMQALLLLLQLAIELVELLFKLVSPQPLGRGLTRLRDLRAEVKVLSLEEPLLFLRCTRFDRLLHWDFEIHGLPIMCI